MRKKQPGKLLLFVLLIGATLIIGGRGFVRGWELQRRLACAEQMKRIGEALKTYSAEIAGLSTSPLSWLVENGVIRSDDLKCPSSRNANYSLHVEGEVVLTEPLSNHDEGTNVLFADGHLSFVPAAERAAMRDKE